MSAEPRPSRWAAGPTALTAADVEALALASFTDEVGCLDAVVEAAAGGAAWTERCRTVLESTLELQHAMDDDADDDPPSWERAQVDLVHLWITRGIGQKIAARPPRELGPPVVAAEESATVRNWWTDQVQWAEPAVQVPTPEELLAFVQRAGVDVVLWQQQQVRDGWLYRPDPVHVHARAQPRSR